jgi:hypothetical protein
LKGLAMLETFFTHWSRPGVLLLSASLGVSSTMACGSDSSTGTPPPPADSGADASGDALDAAADGALDASPDANLDAGGDSARDSGLGDKQCRTTEDCLGASGFCSAFVLLPLCGTTCKSVFSSDCTKDGDCTDAGANAICDKLCACPGGGAVPVAHCSAGCAIDADCGPGLACNGTHRCEPASCGTCPTNFACTSGKCARKSCKADTECVGYCVLGACYATPGTCLPAVP